MATNTILRDNVVAGFERIGYHIDGEPCPGKLFGIQHIYSIDHLPFD